MPIYDYRCEKCDMIWEESLPVSKRLQPTKKYCPHCEEKKCVVKHVGGFPGLATDATLTADKATGGKWSELMNKMKGGISDKYKPNLDTASQRTGARWKG